MGIFLVLGIIVILYLIDKALMAITAFIMAIYIFVKKVKKKKIGKIIILPIVILIVLQLLSLPADLLSVGATVESIKYRKDLKNRDCAFTEADIYEVFTYKGQEYVALDEYLAEIMGDWGNISNFYEPDNFKPFKTLVTESPDRGYFQLFFFTPDEHELYTFKDAVDEEIIYADYGNKIWCKKQNFETAKQTYADMSNYRYYITYEKNGIKKQKEIKASVYKAIMKCEENHKNNNGKYFTDTFSDPEDVYIYAISKDGRVILECLCEDLLVSNGKLYYLYYAFGLCYGKYLNVTLK